VFGFLSVFVFVAIAGEPSPDRADTLQDALRAMVKLHDRLLRGRKLVVTYANSVRCDPPTGIQVDRANVERRLLPTCHRRQKVADLLKRPRRLLYLSSRAVASPKGAWESNRSAIATAIASIPARLR
jgi:hypothetical protein